MPLSATFTWTETKDVVNIIVPLKTASRSSVDIFGASCESDGAVREVHRELPAATAAHVQQPALRVPRDRCRRGIFGHDVYTCCC